MPRQDFPKQIGVWRIANEGCGQRLENRFSLYSAIQLLAVNITEANRSSRLREAKKRLPSPEALQRAADQRDENRRNFACKSEPKTKN